MVSSLARTCHSQRTISNRVAVRLAVIMGASQEHPSHRESVLRYAVLLPFIRLTICIRRKGGSAIIAVGLAQEFPLHFHGIGLPEFGR